MNILNGIVKFCMGSIMLAGLIILFGTGMKIWWLLFSLGWNVL